MANHAWTKPTLQQLTSAAESENGKFQVPTENGTAAGPSGTLTPPD